MKKNFKPLYTSEEAIALTESLVDQDTKFEREVEALINTEEAKDILLKAYNNADDNGKIALADATEEQFLDKYAPDGSAKDKGEEEKKDDTQNDEDFLEDASGLDNDGNQEVTDDGGSEDDQDENIFDDGGSEDDQDTGIDSDNIFAQATSGDETGELTDNGGDNSDNPFLESKKVKATRSLNEHREDPDEIAEELDDLYYGKIWEYINAKIAKHPKAYITKIQSNPEVAKELAEELILKLGIDLSSYGPEGINAFTRVLRHVVGDIYDLQISELTDNEKAKATHSLNEARKAARASKSNRQKIRKLNEHHEDPDEIAEELDDLYYGKIWKYINAKIAKLPKSRDKIMYITKIQTKPEVAKGLAEKLILKLGVDMSSYGPEGINAFTRVLKQVVGDIYDLQTSEW